MGKTVVDDDNRKGKKKVSLKVPEKKKKSAPKVAQKKTAKPIEPKKRPQKKKSRAPDSGVPKPKKAPAKPRHVRVLNDMPFRKFAKDLAKSYGIVNVTDEAKEIFDGLVKELLGSVLDRMFLATEGINTIKDRHVTNVFAQEIIARRNGRNDLLPGLVENAKDVGERYDERYAVSTKE